jgi:hypothetical protein
LIKAVLEIVEMWIWFPTLFRMETGSNGFKNNLLMDSKKEN